MITVNDLRTLARARLSDGIVLFQKQRYDGAIYLCGYAIEMALKARICRTLKWTGFPETRKEFEPYQSFKTHNLDVLLHLSGIEAKIKITYAAEWSAVATWDPESRYRRVGSATQSDVQTMIDSVKVLLRVI